MKRTFICALLCLVLSLALLVLPQTALATEESTSETVTHTHCVCGGTATTANSHVCDATVAWEPFTGTVTDGGHYYLENDTTLTSTITIAENTTVSICLNGKTLDYAGRVFTFKKGGILNLCDCSGEVGTDGKLVFDGYVIAKSATTNGSVFCTTTSSKFHFFGGNLTSRYTTPAANGGVGGLNGGYLYIYDGTISGGRANAKGGNIILISGQLKMFGGTISGGYSGATGGNIHIQGGGATFSGGTVCNGTAATNGGNLYVTGYSVAADGTKSGTSFYINGTDVQITGGVASAGGNVYVNSVYQMAIKSDSAVIADGISSGNGGNLYFNNLAGSYAIEGLTVRGGKAGFTRDQDGTLVAGDAHGGGNLYLAKGTLSMKDVTVDNGEATGNGGGLYIYSGMVTLNKAIMTDNVAGGNGGSIYNGNRAEDTDGNPVITLAIVSNQTLIKGGKAQKGGNIFSGGYTTITYGTIAEGVSSQDGGNIYGLFSTKEDADCGPVIRDGKAGMAWDEQTQSYVVIEEGQGSGGNFYASAATTLAGATLTGGEAASQGGNLYIKQNVTMNLSGCTVTDGNCVKEQSGNIFNYGSLTLKDGTVVTGGTRSGKDIRNLYSSEGTSLTVCDTVTIDGGVSLHQGMKKVTLSGTPTIARFDEEGKLITGVRQLYTITDSDNVGVVIDATGLEEGALVAIDTHVKPYTFADLGTTGNAGAFVPSTTTGVITAATDADGNVTLTMQVGVARAVNGGVNGAPYLTVAEAMADENATHIRLLSDVTEDIVLTGDLILDLNGYVLTGSVTGEGKLYGMDSENDTYNAAKCGRIEGKVSVAMSDVNDVLTAAQVGAARRYMPIADETGYTFHRVFVGVTNVSLRTGNKGFGYKAQFCADTEVLAKLDSFGFVLQLEGKAHNVTRILKADALDIDKVYSLRIRDFDILTYGATPVNADVFMKLKDGTVIQSATVSYSMKTMLQKVTAALESFSPSQIEAIQAMLTQEEKEAMTLWGIEALLNWTPPTTPEENTPEA